MHPTTHAYWQYAPHQRTSINAGGLEGLTLVGNFRGTAANRSSRKPGVEFRIATLKGMTAGVLRLYWPDLALGWVLAIEDPAVLAWLEKARASVDVRAIFDDGEVTVAGLTGFQESAIAICRTASAHAQGDGVSRLCQAIEELESDGLFATLAFAPLTYEAESVPKQACLTITPWVAAGLK